MKLCLHKQRRARRHKPIKKKPKHSARVSRRPMAMIDIETYRHVGEILFGRRGMTQSERDSIDPIGELFRG